MLSLLGLMSRLMENEKEPAGSHGAQIRLGLRENWQQFALLILINAFVGGMVGIERTA